MGGAGGAAKGGGWGVVDAFKNAFGSGSGSGGAADGSSGGLSTPNANIPAWNQGSNDPDASARVFTGGGRFPGGAGPVVVNVAPANVTAVFQADLHGAIDNYMSSGAGDKHFVAMANRKRGALKAALR